MYRTDDCTSLAASSVPRAVGYTVPLDPSLQSRSLHPLGPLQYNRPFASLGFAKAAATLALPSPDATHDTLKIEALKQIIEAIVRPESVSAVLGEEGVFAELMINAAVPVPPVRVLATQALAAVTRARSGREFALTAEVIPRLSQRADLDREPDAQVRRNALTCLLNLSASAQGIMQLLRFAIPKQLIGKLATETDLPSHALCSEVLAEMVREPRAWSDAISAGIVPVLASVLKRRIEAADSQAAAQRVREHPEGVVSTADKPVIAALEQLCRLIAHVSAPALAGKNACVEAGLVSLLVGLVLHPVVAVRVAATLALQNLTNAESGKVAALSPETDALDPLCTAALTDSDEVVQAQAMQSLANLAEHPRGKRDARVTQAVEQLKHMQDEHQSDHVRHAAKLAVDQITWEP